MKVKSNQNSEYYKRNSKFISNSLNLNQQILDVSLNRNKQAAVLWSTGSKKKIVMRFCWNTEWRDKKKFFILLPSVSWESDSMSWIEFNVVELHIEIPVSIRIIAMGTWWYRTDLSYHVTHIVKWSVSDNLSKQ